MYIEEQQTRKVFGSDSTMGLFVALYLILLAFFIILTSVSRQSAMRASEALESVNTTFKELTPARNGESQNAVQSAASDPVLIDIQRAFTSAFNVQGQFAVAGGNIYQVLMPVDYLFEPGSFRVRPSVHPALEELLMVLQQAPTQGRQELALLFGRGQEGQVDRELTRTQQIAIRRAGSFGRFMEERGFSNFSAGFADIGTEEIMLVFRNAAYRETL